MSQLRRRKRRSSTRDVKDRLIQTRVPERLESVLKEEAQKRRLTVSHLIRNMLEDTFELVDSVVAGASELVDESVVIAGQVKSDAGRIAATVRGAAEDTRRIARTVRDAAEDAGKLAGTVRDAVRARSGARRPEPDAAPESGRDEDLDEDDLDELDGYDDEEDTAPPSDGTPLTGLDHVLAWNQVVVNRAVTCAGCGTTILRGSTAHLGMSQDPSAPPTWLCPACLARL